MNEKFKEYTDKGFEFYIGTNCEAAFDVSVDWEGGQFYGEREVIYRGDNLDHAFAACDMWLEGE